MYVCMYVVTYVDMCVYEVIRRSHAHHKIMHMHAYLCVHYYMLHVHVYVCRILVNADCV